MKIVTKDKIATMAKYNLRELRLLQESISYMESNMTSKETYVVHCERREKIECNLPFNVYEIVRVGDRTETLGTFLFEALSLCGKKPVKNFKEGEK